MAFSKVREFGRLASGAPALVLSLAQRGAASIYLLRLTSPPDNRLNPTFLAAFHSALDHLESEIVGKGEPAALVTSGSGKFYSNGLDLAYMMEKNDADFLTREVFPFFTRLIEFPLPTVACINGHAFAGGFLTALCHDYRVMRQGRGFMCMNELQIGIPISPPLTAILKAKITDPQILREVTIQSARIDADQGLSWKILDQVAASEEEALEKAIAIAEAKSVAATTGRNLGIVKADNYADVREKTEWAKTNYDANKVLRGTSKL